jgi:hypothetical protein
MKNGVGLCLAAILCGAAQAADPAPRAQTPSVAPVPAAHATARKPLDLRVGDVRKYMMPNEFRAALGAPDADKNTVVVQGTRDVPPLKSQQPLPGALIAPFWAMAHPLQSWRIFVPDVNRPPDGPTVDKVPPPIFRWGP